MSMQTLTRDVDVAAVAGNSDAYSLALATQARQKTLKRRMSMGGGGGVTFDRALEIVHIILEVRSQIRSLVPMRLLCG